MADPNFFTTPYQLTKGMHRDVYDAVDPANPSLRVEGKVVIVTGAAGGVGYAVATAWANAGAAGVVLVGRNEKKLEEIATDFKSPTLVAAGDISSESDVATIFEKTKAKFGKVDVVINTAFTMNGAGPAGQIEPKTWWSDFEINTKGPYILAHELIKATDGSGTFINFVTLGASFLGPGVSTYASSKLAVIKMAEFLDLENPNLRVFSIHPGIVDATSGRGSVIDSFTPFAKDKQELSAGFTLYLQIPQADHLRGGYVSVNWDVEEMEKHAEEIKGDGLLKLGFVKAKLGAEGHPWKA